MAVEVDRILSALKTSLSLGIPPPRPLASLIFVDRVEEVRALLRDVESVIERGVGLSRLIVGGAGMGKSTLIEYLREYLFSSRNVAFSYVELRKFSDVRPVELSRKLYAALLDSLEDSEERRGRELITHISSTLHEKFSRLSDRLSFRVRGRISDRVRRMFERIRGCEVAARALALMVIDELNPAMYDYLRGIRALEPDEALAVKDALGFRIPWKLEETSFVDSFVTIVNAARLAGYEAVVVAIDELEVLMGWRRDMIERFLPKLSAYVESCRLCSCYLIIASTPEFWSGSGKTVNRLYKFLYQRLDPAKISLAELSREDVLALTMKLFKLYREAYGEEALRGIDERALAIETYERVGGHPRSALQYIFQKLEERAIRVERRARDKE